MAFSFSFPKRRIANFVINDHSIRFVELKHAHPPFAQKWQERILAPGIIRDGKIVDLEALTNILEECVDEWKLKRRSIRFIVPDSFVIIRKVSIPADVKKDELEGYLYLEMGTSIHLPFEDPVFDTYPLKKDGKTKELLLFAASEERVMEYADLFSSVKLNPVAADISPLALYRLYHQFGLADDKEILLTIQFDVSSVTLCIFEKSVPYVMRSFPVEFDAEKYEWLQKPEMDATAPEKTTGNDYELEEMLKEIRMFIDFYRYSLNKGQSEVTKFLLSGDHPLLKKFSKELLDRFDVPLETLNPKRNMGKSKADRIPESFYLALGLALKGVQ